MWFRSGRDRHCVDQLLGTQAPRTRMREIAFVVLVPFVRHDGKLVSARGADRPHQMFGIEAALKKIGSQCFQKRGVARRIARTDIIDWIDDSDAEKITPDA